MFDPNKPYGRTDGKKCSIKYTFKNGNHFVVLEDTDLYEIINYDGRQGAIDNDADLVNIPQKIGYWINIYKPTAQPPFDISMIGYPTEALAIRFASPNVFARLWIEITEGEGLR